MPTYTFTCNTDGRYEVIARMSDYTTEQPCPKCGVIGQRVIDQIPTFIRKGKGWTTPAPAVEIPKWISSMSDEEIDADLGLTNDANANA